MINVEKTRYAEVILEGVISLILFAYSAGILVIYA
jgi:hypothetical protein